MPSQLLTTALIILAAGGFAVWLLMTRGQGAVWRTRPRTSPEPTTRPNRDVEQMLVFLARQSWSTREAAMSQGFEFQVITAPNDLEIFVGELLKHVRRVAPRLEVPEMRPRISIEGMPLAAGQFVEQDGWVKISVSSSFLLDVPASKAILCHEVCHYVLNANGVRLPDNAENERLTDVAMFAFGLGGVFLDGHRRVPRGEYRAGHRLGYLSDDDYAFARQRALDLWRSGELNRSTMSDTQRDLKSAIPDENARRRLVDFARSTFPAASELELIEQVLASYRADIR